MNRTTLAALALLALSAAAPAQGIWPDDPWTDLREVSVAATFENGRTVILDGDVLYSFGQRNRETDYPDGFLQIFDRETRGWTRRPRMENPEIFASANFGLAADVRNGLIAVGAPNAQIGVVVPGEHSPTPLRYGYVRLMRLAPDGLSWSSEYRLANLDVPGPAKPRFGGAVRFLADDLLAIGSAHEDINGVVAAGAVRLYRFDGTEWVLHQRLTIDPSEGLVFGWRIEFASGDLIVAANGGHSFDTAAFIFREDEQGLWTQVQRIPWTDADIARMDADGDLLVLPSPTATTPLGATGEVKVYRRIDQTWTHEATILPEPLGFDPRGSFFGSNVAIDGDSIAIATSSSARVVQIFERTDGQWTFTAQIRPTGASARFAEGMDFDQGRVAIGDPDTIVFNGSDGGVMLWSREPECFRDLRGDANNDGLTNFKDLNLVLSQYGQKGDNLEGDLNNDGMVEYFDLNVVLALFGSPCMPPI